MFQPIRTTQGRPSRLDAGLKPESYGYIEFLTSKHDDPLRRDGTVWLHQWEAFLRVVYAHEILGKTEIGADGLPLNIVTGVARRR